MRPIGRLRSEASPSKVAVIPWPPTTPIIRREPVPALPKSSVVAGRKQRSEAGPADPPAARRQALDHRAERPAGLARPEDVVALEQSFDQRLAAGEQAEDEGAVGNRLVAGRPEAAAKRLPATGAQGGSNVRGRSGHARTSRFCLAPAGRRGAGPYHRAGCVSTEGKEPRQSHNERAGASRPLDNAAEPPEKGNVLQDVVPCLHAFRPCLLLRRRGSGRCVLGSGAGGGVPQWNCACRVCRLAWDGDPRVRPRTQSSVAVSADGERWLLLNASIDLRQQILATPAMQPKGEGRHSPIAAVLLTNADVDHAAGLLALRERQPFAIWGTSTTLDTIGMNRIFDAVGHDVVPRLPIGLRERFEPLPGLTVELFPVPGKVPLWLEEGEVETGMVGEGTVGVAAEAGGRRLVYAPGCARVTDDLHARIARANALFFDGTLFADDEMIAAELGDKTGRRMGHMPVSGSGGTLDELERHDRVRRIFIHIDQFKSDPHRRLSPRNGR